MKYKSFQAEAEESPKVIYSLEFIRKLNMNSCIIKVEIAANMRHTIHSTLTSDEGISLKN